MGFIGLSDGLRRPGPKNADIYLSGRSGRSGRRGLHPVEPCGHTSLNRGCIDQREEDPDAAHDDPKEADDEAHEYDQAADDAVVHLASGHRPDTLDVETAGEAVSAGQDDQARREKVKEELRREAPEGPEGRKWSPDIGVLAARSAPDELEDPGRDVEQDSVDEQDTKQANAFRKWN